MKRFVTALTTALLAVVMIGGVVLTIAGGAGRGAADDARGVLLAQAEDETAEGQTEDDDQAATVRLSPIEQLLARLTPSIESSSLPTAQRVVLSRDPFQPVVPEPAADGGTDGDGTDGDGTDGDGTDGDGTDGDGTDGDGTDGDGTDGDGTDGDGTDGDGTDQDVCAGDDQEVVCDGLVVTLDGFTEDGQAIVTVDDTTFTVGVDDEFATSFRVLAINEPCATLLFGDEAFSICTGATVLK